MKSLDSTHKSLGIQSQHCLWSWLFESVTVGIALKGNDGFVNVLSYCRLIKEKMTLFSSSERHHTDTSQYSSMHESGLMTRAIKLSILHFHMAP